VCCAFTKFYTCIHLRSFVRFRVLLKNLGSCVLFHVFLAFAFFESVWPCHRFSDVDLSIVWPPRVDFMYFYGFPSIFWIFLDFLVFEFFFEGGEGGQISVLKNQTFKEKFLFHVSIFLFWYIFRSVISFSLFPFYQQIFGKFENELKFVCENHFFFLAI